MLLGLWDLGSPTRDWTQATAVKASKALSPNHRTTRELPAFGCNGRGRHQTFDCRGMHFKDIHLWSAHCRLQNQIKGQATPPVKFPFQKALGDLANWPLEWPQFSLPCFLYFFCVLNSPKRVNPWNPRYLTLTPIKAEPRSVLSLSLSLRPRCVANAVLCTLQDHE